MFIMRLACLLLVSVVIAPLDYLHNTGLHNQTEIDTTDSANDNNNAATIQTTKQANSCYNQMPTQDTPKKG